MNMNSDLERRRKINSDLEKRLSKIKNQTKKYYFHSCGHVGPKRAKYDEPCQKCVNDNDSASYDRLESNKYRKLRQEMSDVSHERTKFKIIRRNQPLCITIPPYHVQKLESRNQYTSIHNTSYIDPKHNSRTKGSLNLRYDWLG